jgi:hypothetical protein
LQDSCLKLRVDCSVLAPSHTVEKSLTTPMFVVMLSSCTSALEICYQNEGSREAMSQLPFLMAVYAAGLQVGHLQVSQ